MKPVVNTISPNVVHTGGCTLIELAGANFRLPVEAEDVFPVPKPRASVRVRFGDVDAEEVAVADDGLVYVNAPEHDPGTVDLTVENLDGAPARATTGAQPFALADGMTLEVTVGDAPTQTVVFPSAAFAAIGAATAAEVAAIVSGAVRGVLARAADGRTTIDTDARGSAATILFGGTALAALGLPSELQRGDDDVREPIPGETTIVPSAVTFARPDLGQKSTLVRVFEAFVLKLRRQVIENVHVATHVEYDEDTGDGYNISMIASFPALAIVALEFPDNVEETHANQLEIEDTTGTGFIEKAPPSVVDCVMTIVGICETPIELINLEAIVIRVFKKNPKLRVLRDEAHPERGFVEYDMGKSMTEPVRVSRDGAQAVPLVAWSCQAFIKQISIEDLPLENEGPAPAGTPAGMAHESTVGIGSKNEELVHDVGTMKSS
ncbi:MAG: IPT/TIG domain-containing protein [Polyangiaceae bacterium]|nr:IPT/TIG domain-containing protein [Polyangiaceae bacterium]